MIVLIAGLVICVTYSMGAKITEINANELSLLVIDTWKGDYAPAFNFHAAVGYH